ncbi:MAG: ABC transporter substrate-binding protein [Candidatus Dormibacteraeota bacterium]|nr:ABC transporter substrate-binding protein [Candidatus Dormibacteraeota bacterium]
MTGLSKARSSIWAAAVAGCLVALSACGNANNASSGNTTLTIQGDSGNPTLVENFNPFAGSAMHGVNLIYEPLEIPSPVDGTYTPFLATSNKFSDPKTLVYTIRQNVKWSDGKSFTPADVVFTFNLLKKYPALDTKAVWQQISSVSASGNDVTMNFTAPNVPFAISIAQTPIVPEHLWSSLADPVKDPNTHPVGTGPYMLDSFAPTQYSLKKNTNYWQADKIAADQAVFPAQASNQSTNQLDVVSGKFDWSYNFLPDVKTTYVAKDPAHNQYWFPAGGTIALYLNLTKKPYSDVNFRKGLSMALDRTTIATKAVNGYLDQASMSGLILPNLKKWLDPSLPNQGLVAKDAAGSQAAFAQAGYTMQGGKLMSGGKQATMTIVMPGNFSDWVAAAKEVVNQLGAIGINATLDLPQYAQYSSGIQAGTFDAAIGGFGGSGDPYTDYNLALSSTFATPVNTPTSNNFERFKDPAVDQALTTLASSTDQAAQQQATYTLEQAMYQKVPIVLLYYGGSWGLFSTKRFTGWPSASDPYTLPTSYNNSLLTVVTHIKKA